MSNGVLPLVQYGCGCVGFIPGEDGWATIIDCCDKDAYENELGMTPHEFKNKPYEDVPEHKQVTYSEILKQLIYDGHKWQKLQQDMLGDVNHRIKSLEKDLARKEDR